MMQLVGLLVLGAAWFAGSDFCMETNSCSDGNPVAAVAIGAVGVVILAGGFVAGARRARLGRPVLTGLAAFVIAAGGGALFTALAGARPLVGVVFVVSSAFSLVAARRGPAIGATAAAALVMGLKEASGQESSGVVAATLVVLVALVALVPQDEPLTPAEA